MSTYHYCDRSVHAKDLPATITFGAHPEGQIRETKDQRLVQITIPEAIDAGIHHIAATDGTNWGWLRINHSGMISGFTRYGGNDVVFLRVLIPHITEDTMSREVDHYVEHSDYNPCEECDCDYDRDDEWDRSDCEPDDDYLYDQAHEWVMDNFEDLCEGGPDYMHDEYDS